MFESLGDRLQTVMSKIKGYGKITEENISEMTREIRLALLEADVNYKVVKEFVNNVKEKALGEEVQKSLKPGDVVTIPANVKHWHGATKSSWFSHIAVEVPGKSTSNEWCEPVTDDIYNNL